jgi:hypothetical protein
VGRIGSKRHFDVLSVGECDRGTLNPEVIPHIVRVIGILGFVREIGLKLGGKQVKKTKTDNVNIEQMDFQFNRRET